MSYPGNPSLEREVQERIVTTFRQTLDLVKQKKVQEARLGCEFILRMDPLFQPAQKLLGQLQGGAAAPPPRPAPAPAPRPATDLTALDSLDDLAGLGELDTIAPAAPSPSGLATVLEDLLARRNYAQVMQIATSQQAAIAADPRLRALVEKAASAAESEPFIRGFLETARRAVAESRVADAERELEKARSLDPTHPAIAELETLLESVATVASDALPSPEGEAGAGVLSFGEDADDGVLSFGEEPSAAPVPARRDSADLADLAALQAASLSLGDDDELSFDDELPPTPADATPASGEAAPALAGFDVDEGVSFGDEGPTFGGEAPSFGGGDDELSFDEEPSAPPAVQPLRDEADSLSFADLDAEPGAAEPAAPESAAPQPEAPQPTLPAPAVSAPAPAPPAAAAKSPPRRGIGAPDEGDRVLRLLEEGQAAFDRGEYQSAIDVWSRIFLIEIDNAEASRRIEQARSRKAELERKAEERFHEAVAKIESRDLEAAKEILARVLELQPGHNTARDYLDQLNNGQVPAVRRKEGPGELDDLAGLAEAVEGGEPKKSLEAAVARDRIVAVKKTDKKLIALGAAVLVGVIGLIAFLVMKWDSLFPNAAPPPPPAQAQVSSLDRAKSMKEAGNVENAILLLQRIGPEDPAYPDAQALMQEWKALVQAPEDATQSGPDGVQLQRRTQILAAAREAHERGYHLRATSYFDRAARIAPLETADLELKRASQTALEPVKVEIDLFKGGDYEQAIPRLWKLREEQPLSKDVEQLLVDCYYNLALQDLQRGDPHAAMKKLEDALDATHDRDELERLLRFAKTYTTREQDLLYRIYVKYLPSR